MFGSGVFSSENVFSLGVIFSSPVWPLGWFVVFGWSLVMWSLISARSHDRACARMRRAYIRACVYIRDLTTVILKQC